MKSLLSVQNLKVGIKQEREWIFPILDVNLEVGYRETVGLVGESGSGKSLTAMALLKLLSKLTTRIEAKKMQLGNINLLSAEKKLMQKVLGAQVGFVMQNAQGCLNPTMKIKDQIIESMLIHGIFSDKAQALFESKRLLDLVEIQNSSHVLNCYPYELSGGMKQRVVIAAAVATKPKLLIADEPTSSLDIESQEATLDLFKTIQNEFYTSILLITHDLNLAKNFCEKITVMYAGKTIESMRKTAYSNSFHPYTQHLLDSKPTLKSSKEIPLFTLEQRSAKVSPNHHCPFVFRCPKAMNICVKNCPVQYNLNDHHQVSCFLAQAPIFEDILS